MRFGARIFGLCQRLRRKTSFPVLPNSGGTTVFGVPNLGCFLRLRGARRHWPRAALIAARPSISADTRNGRARSAGLPTVAAALGVVRHQPSRIGLGEGVACGVGVGLVGVGELGVGAGELAGGGVVVAVEEIDEAVGVGVAAGVAERGGGGETAGGPGVAPCVVAGSAGEGAGAAHGAADGSEGVGDQVGDGAGGEVDLFGGREAVAVDVSAGAVHEQFGDGGRSVPDVSLGEGGAARGGDGGGGAQSSAVVAGGGHIGGGVVVTGEFLGAVPGAGRQGGGSLCGFKPLAIGVVGVAGGGS